MNDANLIPKHRLYARRRRRRLNLWATGGTAYLVLLLGAYASCYALWGGGGDAATIEQERAKARIQQTKQLIAAAQSELAAGERTLEANRALQSHPDWSLLLLLPARSMDDDVILSHCELKPDNPPGDRPSPEDGAGGFRLDISGYGKTVTAVSRLALKLERTELFDQVRLLKTKRQPLLSGSATCFQIECFLDRKPESPQ